MTVMVKKAAITIINFYQKRISILFPPCCRFSPTCSEYTKQAIDIHGFSKGSWMGIKRICRCHPFNKSEYYDPVPGGAEQKEQQ